MSLLLIITKYINFYISFFNEKTPFLADSFITASPKESFSFHLKKYLILIRRLIIVEALHVMQVLIPDLFCFSGPVFCVVLALVAEVVYTLR